MNFKKRIAVVFILISLFSYGQNKVSIENLSNEKEEENVKYKHSIGSSLFMLGNIIADESPDYFLLTYGYRFTKKDRIFAEFNTWQYSESLGTYGHSKEFYPGFVRAFGIGIGYQRFHWKGVFTTVSATSFVKQYHDIDDTKTQKGFQLYLQAITGYRFEFFKNRFYIEPAFALKYWPIDTNFPADFSKIEKGKPKYIFEPSLNFGFRF